MSDKGNSSKETEQERLELIRSYIKDRRVCVDMDEKIKDHNKKKAEANAKIDKYVQNKLAMSVIAEAGKKYDLISEYRKTMLEQIEGLAEAVATTLTHEQKQIESAFWDDLAYCNEQDGTPKVELPKTYSSKKD